MKRHLKGVIIVLILSLIAAWLSVASSRTGGQANYSNIYVSGSKLNNYAFLVNQSDINSKGYYSPNNIVSPWKVYGPPPGQGICNTTAFADPEQTIASGWPLRYNYDIGDCGTRSTFLPMAFIIDWLVFILIIGCCWWLLVEARAALKRKS